MVEIPLRWHGGRMQEIDSSVRYEIKHLLVLIVVSGTSLIAGTCYAAVRLN